MNLRPFLFAISGLTLMIQPSFASYMATCDALISKWKQCGGDLAACTIIELEIMQQCKCHQFDEARFEWVMLSPEIAPDGVCGNFEPIPEEPGPGDPVPDQYKPKPGDTDHINLPVPKIGVQNAPVSADAAAEGAAVGAASD